MSAAPDFPVIEKTTTKAIAHKGDFNFFKNVIDHFHDIGQDLGLREIIKYLNEHPEVIEINQYRHEDFINNQRKRATLILDEA